MLLLSCAFFSGSAGLTYEVLWDRNVLLVFGSTAYSAAGLLAAFMAGLAVGSALIGRWGAGLSGSDDTPEDPSQIVSTINGHKFKNMH